MQLFSSWLIFIVGLSVCATELVNAKNGTVSDEVAVATRPFFTPSNETLNAEKLLFSPLSTDASSSSITSSLEELKKYDPNSEFETIQNPGKKQSSSDLEEQYMRNNDIYPSSITDESIEVDQPHLRRHRDIAIVSAMVLAILCLFIYTALVFWRRSLENRYGGLERLITEDDFAVDI